MAACLVLLVSAGIWLWPGGGISITMSGQELTAQAVQVEQPDISAVSRAYSLEPAACITVPLELKADGSLAIAVSGGAMQVFDGGNGELLYEGECFQWEERLGEERPGEESLGEERDILIYWTVEAQTQRARYEMSVENEKTACLVVLTYSEDWMISKVKR